MRYGYEYLYIICISIYLPIILKLRVRVENSNTNSIRRIVSGNFKRAIFYSLSSHLKNLYEFIELNRI